MDLFLVKFSLSRTDYPCGSGSARLLADPNWRLVEASTEEEAAEKLRLAEEIDRPYSFHVTVEDLVVYPVIR